MNKSMMKKQSKNGGKSLLPYPVIAVAVSRQRGRYQQSLEAL